MFQITIKEAFFIGSINACMHDWLPQVFCSHISMIICITLLDWYHYLFSDLSFDICP